MSAEDELPPQLREILGALASIGVPVSVQVIRMPRPDQAAPAAQPAEACTLPHTPCPVCKAGLCFGPANDAPRFGVCRGCASLIVSEREPLPRAVRVMTEDEVIGLADDDRIALVRAQTQVLQLIARRRGRAS